LSSTKKIAVTGGAGFMGSILAKALVDTGASVTVIDNLSTGSLKNLKHLLDNPNFTFIKADLTKLPDTFGIINNCDAVFHLAANPDVRIGSSDTIIYLQLITFWKRLERAGLAKT
jgi:UDP-glucose 4-epimerase